MTLRSGYDDFAGIYDRHWGVRYAERAMRTLDPVLLAKLPKNSKILDLCCGSGRISAKLTERGFQVIGLDVSSELVSLARKNAPDASFVVADACNFRLEPEFDGVVCLNDSINHMLTREDLLKTLLNVANSLVPGGLFLFDINLHHKYSTSWDSPLSIIEDDVVCAINAMVDPQDSRAYFDAAIFVRDGSKWRRDNVRLCQTWYALEDVQSMLTQSGFSSVEVTDQFGSPLKNEDVDKAFLLCKKP